MKTTIITAIYDNYDIPKSILPQEDIDVDWLFVTEDYGIALTAESLGWSPYIDPRDHLHPNRAAKMPKCLPWLFVDTPSSIWIDGSYKIESPTFAKDVLELANPIAQFTHPWRNCAYLEAEECVLINKYAGQPFQAQMKYLESVGHPKNWGLWATGVIARWHEPSVVRMGFDWLRDIHLWSFQDQVSHPNVLRLNELRPVSLPGTHLANEWASYQGSERH